MPFVGPPCISWLDYLDPPTTTSGWTTFRKSYRNSVQFKMAFKTATTFRLSILSPIIVIIFFHVYYYYGFGGHGILINLKNLVAEMYKTGWSVAVLALRWVLVVQHIRIVHVLYSVSIPALIASMRNKVVVLVLQVIACEIRHGTSLLFLLLAVAYGLYWSRSDFT